MNVLSLFDGISCGQVALNRAGISYNKILAFKRHLANHPNDLQAQALA